MANSADLPGDGLSPEAERQERFTRLFARHVDELKSHIGFLVPL